MSHDEDSSSFFGGFDPLKAVQSTGTGLFAETPILVGLALGLYLVHCRSRACSTGMFDVVESGATGMFDVVGSGATGMFDVMGSVAGGVGSLVPDVPELPTMSRVRRAGDGVMSAAAEAAESAARAATQAAEEAAGPSAGTPVEAAPAEAVAAAASSSSSSSSYPNEEANEEAMEEAERREKAAAPPPPARPAPRAGLTTAEVEAAEFKFTECAQALGTAGLSKTAFKMLVKQIVAEDPRAKPPAPKDLDAAFGIADADHNGTVDLGEFVTLVGLVKAGGVRGIGGGGFFGGSRTVVKKRASFREELTYAREEAAQLTHRCHGEDEALPAPPGVGGGGGADDGAEYGSHTMAQLQLQTRHSQDDGLAGSSVSKVKALASPPQLADVQETDEAEAGVL